MATACVRNNGAVCCRSLRWRSRSNSQKYEYIKWVLKVPTVFLECVIVWEEMERLRTVWYFSILLIFSGWEITVLYFRLPRYFICKFTQLLSISFQDGLHVLLYLIIFLIIFLVIFCPRGNRLVFLILIFLKHPKNEVSRTFLYRYNIYLYLSVLVSLMKKLVDSLKIHWVCGPHIYIRVCTISDEEIGPKMNYLFFSLLFLS